MGWEKNKIEDVEWAEVCWKNALIFGKYRDGDFFVRSANGDEYRSTSYTKVLTEGMTPEERKNLGFVVSKLNVPAS